MPEETSIQTTLNELNELIVNCPDFEKLEGLLGGFNIFQVLKFEHGEIRHSNVLAWIMDPTGSHGLGSTFLKKWLMRILHESSSKREMPVAPVDIDSWQFVDVEVRREWLHIDLLIVMRLADGSEFIVVIENKIRSTEGKDQLKKYREVVEKQFRHAKKLFIFLTKDLQEPTDTVWEPASYDEVHTTLKECLQSRSNAIGAEPKVLLENYIKLIEEKFMDESEIAKTAQSIYKQHKRALDVIFEHRPNTSKKMLADVKKLLEKEAQVIHIKMDYCTNSILRFLPQSWAEKEGNSSGEAWKPASKRSVLFEVKINENKCSLSIVSGIEPRFPWLDELWKLSGKKPFRRRRVTQANRYNTLHSINYKINIVDDEAPDTTDLSQKIYAWIKREYLAEEMQKVIQEVSQTIPQKN